MRANPYQVIEGVDHRRLRRRRARGVHRAQGHVRRASGEAVTRAVEEMQAGRDLRATSPITIVAGPDEYLFGEEKALLEVIEGNAAAAAAAPALRARPVRHRAADGLGGDGAEPGHAGAARVEPDAGEQRRDAGQRAPHPGPGRGVVPVDGHRRVARQRDRHRRGRRGPPRRGRDRAGHAAAHGHRRGRQGVARRPLGQGGALRRRQPGGHRRPTSTSPVSYEGMPRLGSGLGAAGFIVFDDTACMVEVARRSRASSTSSRAASARRASSARARSPPGSNGIEAGAGDDARRRRASALAADGHRRQPLLPRRGGAAGRGQPPARVPRGVRRAPRRRPLPPAAARAVPQSSTWRRRRSPTTSACRKRPDWTYADAPEGVERA